MRPPARRARFLSALTRHRLARHCLDELARAVIPTLTIIAIGLAFFDLLLLLQRIVDALPPPVRLAAGGP